LLPHTIRRLHRGSPAKGAGTSAFSLSHRSHVGSFWVAVRIMRALVTRALCWKVKP
jgi:hypothetical protein